jgi:hypothetical protein
MSRLKSENTNSPDQTEIRGFSPKYFWDVFLTTAISEYQMITYSGPTAESLNKPAFCEYAKGIGNGRAGKACVFDNKTFL